MALRGPRGSLSALQRLHLRADLRGVVRGLEDPVGRLAEQHDSDLLQRRVALEMPTTLVEQDLGAALLGEARDPGADRGNRDGLAAALARELEAAPDRGVDARLGLCQHQGRHVPSSCLAASMVYIAHGFAFKSALGIGLPVIWQMP